MPRRTVLLIAYHFPPCHGSSGIQRTLRFAQHLPASDWRPIVLTISPRAYGSSAEARGNELPDDLLVHRSFGLDTARHLSLFGRYPGRLALPDRWATWRHWAVRDALRLIETHGVDVVWSTFPIATAHRIGLEVARRSGLPWIAEFRDPMWQGDHYPTDPTTNAAWRLLEKQVFERADRVVVTTPGTVDAYRARFPSYDPERIVLIENGYDEDVFQRAAAGLTLPTTSQAQTGRPIRLLHSGIIYENERDPTQFFAALAAMRNAGTISSDTLQVVLRASGHDADYRRRLLALGIEDIVRLEPAVDYLSAIREMMTVDGLLILQGSGCNAQVPAKLYEYLRAGRPILALTDPVGDTARTLRTAGTGIVAPLDDALAIERSLSELIATLNSNTWIPVSDSAVGQFSRRRSAQKMSDLLCNLVEP